MFSHYTEKLVNIQISFCKNQFVFVVLNFIFCKVESWYEILMIHTNWKDVVFYLIQKILISIKNFGHIQGNV